MSSTKLVLKSQGIALALKNMFGVAPVVDYTGNMPRIYYRREDLPQVRRNFNSMMKRKGDIKVDWLQITGHYIVPRAILLAVLMFGGFYAVNKVLRKKKK